MSEISIVEDGVRIEIGECRLDTDADIALAGAYADLDHEERARAAAFVFDRDRERFVRAHGYLRRRLGGYLGLAPRDVPLTAGEDGKPFAEGQRVSFNLSHAGPHAVVAITRSADVGIDIETVDRFDGLDEELDGLSQACLTGDEQAALVALPRPRRVRRFLTYWTAKEARMKLTGEGMSLEPRAIALQLADGLPVGYRRPRRVDARLRFVPLLAPDVICCLALDAGAAHRPAAG